MTTTPETNPVSPDETVEESTSRRNAIRALVVGGGAAAGVVAFGKSASAAPEDVFTENTYTPEEPTILDYEGVAITEGPSVFSAGGYVPPADFPYPAGIGGYGDDSVPNGVHGSTTNLDGFGVVAAHLGEVTDTDNEPAPAGLAVASLNGPQILFASLGAETVGPTEGVHVAGELYRDADGTLWFTVPVDGDPDNVRFVALAGSPAAGSFHSINPQRAYDSRQAGFSPDGGSMLDPNSSRVISVADGHDGGGNVTLADAVPEGATAVQINLTAANPTAENYLAVTDGDTTSTETSVLNWGVDELQIANSITVPVNDAREIRVYCGDQNGSTHFIVDVFGYYR